MKMSSACSFVFMQIKVIFIRMVSHMGSCFALGLALKQRHKGYYCAVSGARGLGSSAGLTLYADNPGP